MARGSIYGTRDAGRSFCIHCKQTLERAGASELSMERAVYAFSFGGSLKAPIQPKPRLVHWPVATIAEATPPLEQRSLLRHRFAEECR